MDGHVGQISDFFSSTENASEMGHRATQERAAPEIPGERPGVVSARTLLSLLSAHHSAATNSFAYLRRTGG